MLEIEQTTHRQRLVAFFARQRTDGLRMTQAQFADRLGMHRISAGRVLSGAQAITPEFIGKFILAFGPDAYAEVFGDEQPTAAPCSEATA